MKYKYKISAIILIIISIFTLSSCGILSRPKEVEKQNTVDIENLTRYDFNESLKTTGPLTEEHLPSKGDVNVLVVPIAFKNENHDPNLINLINKAFNGTEEETGYYSVRGFYEKSSFGQLNFNFDVLDDFYTPFNTSYYYERSMSVYGSTLLYQEILNYYDNEIDYNKYDNDKDGIIDSIWMVYTHPVDVRNADFWWAYVANEGYLTTKDGVKGHVYGFAGTDFLDPLFFTENKVYDYSNINIDAHTYIHETGHMMGLDDYYDYDDNSGVSNGGTYGYDYMDYNYGDHGPINKLLLDWINPIVVTDKCDIVINPYQENGDVYLLTKSFKGTIYDSYYLIINYSNTGLYSKDPYFDESGIIIYEINAEKNIIKGNVVPNGGTYQTGFRYDNSDESKLFVNILGTRKTIYDMTTNKHLLLTKGEYINIDSVGMRLTVNSVIQNGDISISLN